MDKKMTEKIFKAAFLSDFGNGQGVACHTTIPSGRGTKSITVVIEAEKIKLIAAALAHTSHVGHAVWHAENHGFYHLPCSGCLKS